MKSTSRLVLASLVPVFLACSGTATDPKTVIKGDLNPPFLLQSVTSNEQMILQWNITNTEKDIAGYNVYIAETSLAALKAKLPAALQARYDLSSSQIRRCDGTKALFSVFKFSEADKYAGKSCDDFAPDTDAASAAAPSTSSGAGSGTIGSEADPAKSNFVKCLGGTGDADVGKTNLLSVDIAKATNPLGELLPADAKGRVGTTIRCKINKDTVLSDGTKGFVNGKKYVAFVIAVAGDSANKISYSSNFVEDVPAAYTSIPFTLEASKYSSIAFPKNEATGELTGVVSKAILDEACTPAVCKINKALDARSDALVAKDARVFIFSDVQNESERIFVAGEKNQVYLIPQTPRANLYGKPGIYVPGDTALKFDAGTATSPGSDEAATGSYQSGRNLVAYPGSLFSMVVKDGAGKIHYGKLYLDSLSTDAASSSTPGKKSFSLWAVVQTAIDEVLVESLNPLKVGGLN